MEKKYALVGKKQGTDRVLLIATFDDPKDALEYIRRSKLSSRHRARINPGMVYRPDSLLRKCIDAWVEEYYEKTPHNPTIERIKRVK